MASGMAGHNSTWMSQVHCCSYQLTDPSQYYEHLFFYFVCAPLIIFVVAHTGCSLAYLRRVAGPRTVPVELGSRYTDHEWSQKLMTVSEFIDDHLLVGHKVKANMPRAYLAQHHLFDQVSEC